MIETRALSPSLGVEVTGVGDPLDDVPTKTTTLTARHVAATGGGTESASTYAAYENLPAADRKRYDGLRVVHGLERAESRALLDELPAWCTQERFRYAHDRRVGDFVMWDNTGMPHRALPYGPSSERTPHRTTVVGDEALT